MKRIDPLAHLGAALDALDARGLRRHPRAPQQPGAISFCSNDYLGLAARTRIDAPSGAGASRLVAGERTEHEALEREVASFLGVESCLAFTSGYAANVGALSALLEPDDVVISDALNHASLIDGMRLARVRPVVVPHNDAAAIERALVGSARGVRRWVVVESYYSMDADGPDLGRLRRLCDEHDAALVVDEAHAAGVLGPDGRGRCAEAGITPDVLVVTLGKSFGSQGALVGGRAVLREWLWNRARSFVFSTGLSPASAEAGRAAVARARAEPALRERALRLATRARTKLAAIEGIQPLGFGHVVPIVLGAPARALAFSKHLAAAGIDLPAIRPPTVPDGTSRLRLTLTASHTDDDVDTLVREIAAAARFT
ncbi:MAG: 8-amino-7-oxononanoate synthase [Labilithrix sp.]|nr:8-amino-7-oxononanoate synthase [Labilithrix sp.]MCW5810387.1 8-amino-7-oxononanoate synthase [Labilithrix sp.]